MNEVASLLLLLQVTDPKERVRAARALENLTLSRRTLEDSRSSRRSIRRAGSTAVDLAGLHDETFGLLGNGAGSH
jgi:hypothetical protein